MSTRPALSREDPQVNSKIIYYRSIVLHYSSIDIIRKHWFQYKKITVILAYLQKVHRLFVGFCFSSTASFNPC